MTVVSTARSSLFVAALMALAALPAAAGVPPPTSPITFTLTWEGVGNGASAIGTVTFADRSVLRAAAGHTCTLSNPITACGITDLSVTVTGSMVGNGTHTLASFTGVAMNASLPFDLDEELIGQPGFTDFNLFGVSPVPNGEAPFILNTGGLSMRLVSMIGPGSTTLVVTSPSMACATGGTDVLVGIDLDRDGVLDIGELESTTTICNGEDGADPLIDLVAADTATCPAGGSVMTTGLDDDGDGVLDAEEVTDTATLCNGAAGSNGTDGVDGTNGTNGTNGADGEDGGCAATAGPPALWLFAGLLALGRRRRGLSRHCA